MKKLKDKYVIYLFSNDDLASENISFTKSVLDELITQINSNLKIVFNCTIEIGKNIFTKYDELLNNLFNDAKQKYGYIDANWLYAINWYTRQSENHVIDYYKSYYININILLQYFKMIKINDKEYPPINKSCFYSLRNFRLKNGQGPFGVNIDKYPRGISIDTTSYRESIFHEFLHLFGVNDGYDADTKETICDDECWMQWNAKRGSRLCEKHLGELREFINNCKK